MACETIRTFFTFLRYSIFQNQKKHDILRFFELLHKFSRTLPTARQVASALAALERSPVTREYGVSDA